MSDRNKPAASVELDALRLFALGRVPRCARCPRYRVMLAFEATAAGLPEPPEFCTYQICAPLAARLARPAAVVERYVSRRAESREPAPRATRRPRSFAG